MASSLLAPARVDYPSSDGQPMAETDHQRTPLTYAIDALRDHFRDRPDVYVSGNLFIYYQKGNPRAVVAPDVFVVLGADNAAAGAGAHRRRVSAAAATRELADGTPALASAVLGLELRLTERGLRFHDPQTGENLSNLGETDAARQRAEQERQEADSRLAQEAAARRQEAAARQAAEARVAELEDLLRQTRGSDSSGDR